MRAPFYSFTNFFNMPYSVQKFKVGKVGNKNEFRMYAGFNNGFVRVLDFLLRFDCIPSGDIYDWIMGQLCNIPLCCIKKYIEFDDIEDLAKDYLRQLNGKKDPYDIKIGERITQKYISYIPCSPDCEGTKKRYSHYRLLWKKMYDTFSVDPEEIKKLVFK